MGSKSYTFRVLSVLSLVIAVVPPLCAGQAADGKSGLFQWGFGNNFLGTSIPTCQNISLSYIALGSNTTTPPYYMMAFPLGGTPRTYPLGSSNTTSWSWVNDYPPDTKLMLNVVDNNGSAGGVPPKLFTSVPGTNTACIKNDDPSDFTISANATKGGDLSTCEPWAVTLSGGVPPYTFILPALNSAVVTNVSTLTPEENAMVYINRANPGTNLLVAASDFSGKFAYGSPWVQTTGSTDYDCPGLDTVTVTSAQIQADQEKRSQEAAQAAAAKKKKNTTIGAVVGVLGAFLLAALVIGGLYWRRKQQRKRKELDLVPRVYDPDYSTTATTPGSPCGEMGEYSPYGPYGGHDASSTLLSGGSRVLSYDGGPHSPPPGARKPSKGTTASYYDQRSSTFTGSTGFRQSHIGPDGVEEVIVQHEDAGPERVVRELPPPYADRTRVAAGVAPSTIGSESAMTSASASSGAATPFSDTTSGYGDEKARMAMPGSSSTLRAPQPQDMGASSSSYNTYSDAELRAGRGEKRREIVPLPQIPTPIAMPSHSGPPTRTPSPNRHSSVRALPIPPIPPSSPPPQ